MKSYSELSFFHKKIMMINNNSHVQFILWKISLVCRSKYLYSCSSFNLFFIEFYKYI